MLCKMGIETGFIKLGMSDLVGDLRDMSLAHLGLSIMGLLGGFVVPIALDWNVPWGT